MRIRFLPLAAGSLLALSAYACATSDGSVTTDPSDDDDAATGTDSARADVARPDTSTPTDAGTDTSETEEDASIDVLVDAPKDTGTETGTDAGLDASNPLLAEAGTFMVVRVGTAGSGVTLSSASAAVFLEERKLENGAVTRTLPMPVAAAAGNAPLTLRGTSTTEGALALSANGAYAVLAGYSAIPGVADVAETMASATPRVVARVSAAGVIETTTSSAEAFDGKSVRAATSDDGSAFWISGENGNGATGGVWYVPFGATAATQILVEPSNMRTVGLFGGQLYGSTVSGAAGNTLRIFTIGAGLPTTAGQTGTQLNGITAANTTPHGFVLLDLDAAVAGVDTMYVADGRSLASGGGVQKWQLGAGGTWTLTATFKTGLTGAPVNVMAKKVGAIIAVVCVTLDNPAKIVRFIDDGVNTNPTGATLGTGTANFAQYRGIAAAPL